MAALAGLIVLIRVRTSEKLMAGKRDKRSKDRARFSQLAAAEAAEAADRARSARMAIKPTFGRR